MGALILIIPLIACALDMMPKHKHESKRNLVWAPKHYRKVSEPVIPAVDDTELLELK